MSETNAYYMIFHYNKIIIITRKKNMFNDFFHFLFVITF